MQEAPDLEEDADCEIAFGINQLLLMVIDCLPSSMQSGEERETFVLAHPDLDAQNVLAKEDGTITAFIDWDNVHTVPDTLATAGIPPGLRVTGTRRDMGLETPSVDLKTLLKNSSIIVSIM